MNYYNEHDPKIAAWLRELIKQGHLPAGDVDERSIEDVAPCELEGYTQCHFFAGIGGWPLALRLAGWPDGKPVWTGSCPCQPFSTAGKGEGIADKRHLWPAFKWHIQQRRPPIVFGEQVASKLGREWIAGVEADLEDLGYAVQPFDLCAASVGAPHIRQRLYWVAADTNGQRRPGLVALRGARKTGQWNWRGQEDLQLIARSPFLETDRWPKPLLQSVDDGLPWRMGGVAWIWQRNRSAARGGVHQGEHRSHWRHPSNSPLTFKTEFHPIKTHRYPR